MPDEPRKATAAPTDQPAGAPESDGEVDGLTVFDGLRQSYARATEERRTTIPIVPAVYRGMLAARYHQIDYDELRKRTRRLATGSGPEAELNYGAQLIADACETILYQPPGATEMKPMHECVEAWKGGPPVRFDHRLAQALKMDPPPEQGASPATIVRLVFMDPVALDWHFNQLNSWLRGMQADEDEEERPT